MWKCKVAIANLITVCELKTTVNDLLSYSYYGDFKKFFKHIIPLLCGEYVCINNAIVFRPRKGNSLTVSSQQSVVYRGVDKGCYQFNLLVSICRYRLGESTGPML